MVSLEVEMMQRSRGQEDPNTSYVYEERYEDIDNGCYR